MRVLIKIVYESIRQAQQQLWGNKLRSFLSLLGISIGIFCIIGVLSAVDSLEDNIRGSMEKLGNDVIYVQKWPWADMGDEWWKYFRRPHPRFEEYELVRDRVRSADLATFFIGVGQRTLKWNAKSVDEAFLVGVSREFDEMFKFEYYRGRFFSPTEYHYGANKVVLGYTVADALFEGVEPIGKRVKLQGGYYEVIGVLDPSGDELINPLDFDEAIFVSYTKVRSLTNVRNRWSDTFIAIKANERASLDQLKDEVRGYVRANRRLKPRMEDNFSFNELSMVSEAFDSFFSVLNLLGFVIGIFSILVGGVSVANIMFVSVKERTNIIGVKKALGAKRQIILLEFLIEAVILCLLGGAVGLLLIAGILAILTSAIGFELYVDIGNILLGCSVSILIGVIAGFIPAYQASRLDPVDAMRQ